MVVVFVGLCETLMLCCAYKHVIIWYDKFLSWGKIIRIYIVDDTIWYSPSPNTAFLRSHNPKQLETTGLIYSWQTIFSLTNTGLKCSMAHMQTVSQRQNQICVLLLLACFQWLVSLVAHRFAHQHTFQSKSVVFLLHYQKHVTAKTLPRCFFLHWDPRDRFTLPS